MKPDRTNRRNTWTLFFIAGTMAVAVAAADPNTCDYNTNLEVAQIFGPMSHNTYIEAPSYAAALATVRAVEVDIWDCEKYAGSCLGDKMDQDWYVRHGCANLFKSECTGNTNHCGSGDQPFSTCLRDIKSWHDSNPSHPLITVFIDKKQDWGDTRRPSDLDQVISNVFGSSLIFTPQDLLQSQKGDSLRTAAQNGWPSAADLQGKFMFILTGGRLANHNDTQSDYVAARQGSAIVFVAPDTDEMSDVTGVPNQFNDSTAKWVVAYNIEWSNASGTLGAQIRDLGYLSHIWDMNPEDDAHYTTAINTFEINYIGLDEDVGSDWNNGRTSGGYNCGGAD